MNADSRQSPEIDQSAFLAEPFRSQELIELQDVFLVCVGDLLILVCGLDCSPDLLPFVVRVKFRTSSNAEWIETCT